jgi:hypothetical protein
MCCKPPLEIVVPLAAPPEETISVPPLKSMAPALPPRSTSCTAPRETVAPLATPPDETI